MKVNHWNQVMEQTCMMVFVLRSPTDCSNNGVTSRLTNFTLCRDEAIALEKVQNGMDPESVLYLNFDYDRVCAYPVSKLLDKKWYMAGGNYVVASDSRYVFRYPIGVHDRVE